ncbi:hypothetical protein TSUD_272140 [Trifolium subterraneum]|uniref:S-locus glycoprotein domain-containing protein n=1 Tax=Trifolium subterraneum TaxID=3900 RepID=A0A2Z6PCC1_TRISU|nr:hypothetical protein TSUD_272140 [Trifolium subterraneum]
MDVSGQIKQFTWLESTQQWNLFWSQPRGQCQVYAFCGAFGSCNENSKPYCNCLNGYEPKSQSDWDLGDYSHGCVKRNKFQCELSQDDSNGQTLFLKLAASEFSDSKSNKGTTIGIVAGAVGVHQGGNVISLLDSRLDGDADVEEITRVIKIASWCVQDDEAHRPSMGQVVQILEGVLDVTLPPIPRSLQAFIDDHEDIVFFTDSSSTHDSQVKSNVSTVSSQPKSNISSAST